MSAPGRVAHVLWRLGEPSETFIEDTLQQLDGLGWEAWALPFGVINRERFPFPPDSRIVRPRPGGLRGATTIGRRRRAAGIAAAARSVRPALIHAHFGPVGLDALPAAKRLRLPFVVSFHGFDLTRLPDSARMLSAYRRLLKGADAVTVCSQFLAERAIAILPELKPIVIPAGIDTSAFPYRPPRRGGARLLFVGRQIEMKGLDVLLHALARVAAHAPEVQLEVVGDGPLRAASEALAVALGIDERVQFRGELPRHSVAEAMRRADILVVPSRTATTGHAEGHPTVVKEALSTGTLVVATDNGGLPETVPAELRSELVPEGDRAALAERVLAVLAAGHEWERRATLGRVFVVRSFDWMVLAPQLAALYESISGGRGSRRGL